jgi:hypothetical protein
VYIKGHQKKGHTSRVILTTHQKWCFVFFVEAFKTGSNYFWPSPWWHNSWPQIGVGPRREKKPYHSRGVSITLNEFAITFAHIAFFVKEPMDGCGPWCLVLRSKRASERACPPSLVGMGLRGGGCKDLNFRCHE